MQCKQTMSQDPINHFYVQERIGEKNGCFFNYWSAKGGWWGGVRWGEVGGGGEGREKEHFKVLKFIIEGD